MIADAQIHTLLQELALPSVLFLLWGICLTVAIRYRRLGKLCAEQQKHPLRTSGLPAVSIIIPCQNEAKELAQNLPLLLEQEYPEEIEIIVVDMRSEDNTIQMLEQLEKTYPQLHHTFCPSTARDISLHRLALTLGVRAADAEWLVFTQPDCTPSSPKWLLHLMQQADTQADAILGMGTYRNPRKWTEHKWHFFHLWQGLKWLTHAQHHTPYRADEACICYRKSHFLRHQGFASSYKLCGGTETLLVNHNIEPGRCRISLTPPSILSRSFPVEGSWQKERIFFMETRRHTRRHCWYRTKYAIDVLSRLAFALLCIGIAALSILLPTLPVWESKLFSAVHPCLLVGILWTVLIVIRCFALRHTTRCLKVEPILLSSLLMINLIPLWDTSAWLRWRFSNKKMFKKKFV